MRSHVFHTIVLLGLLLAPISQAAVGCSSSFANLRTIVSEDVLKERLVAYVNHQNNLRRELGLVTVNSKDLEKALKSIPKSVSYKRPILIKRVSPIYEVHEKILIPLPKIDDYNFLNYVYEFEESRLRRTIPAAEYFLEQFPRETIRISRRMSWNEYRLWEVGNLAKLRHDGMKQNGNWGYRVPKVHFAIGSSYVPRPAELSLEIPKEKLLEWARKRLITFGCERFYGSDRLCEVVILDGAWEELSKYLSR